MILVDSSCWIEAYRRDGDPRVRSAVREALEDGSVATCGIVWVEVLAFVREGRERRLVEADMDALTWLESSRAACERAAAIGRALRAGGTTVPATDLLIAATAIEGGAALLHTDAHYGAIAGVSPLRERSARGRP